MDLDVFWSVVAQARVECEQDEPWPSGGRVGEAVARRLEGFALPDLLDFDRVFADVVGQADQWQLCAACFLISGYLSDDGFSDFKAGLVCLGRDAFEGIIADPDSLANRPIVVAIASGEAGAFTLHGEAMQYAAANAYAAKTGDDEGFWDQRWEPDRTHQRQRAWSGSFGPADAPEIPTRMPRLYRRFPRALASPS